MAFRTNHLPYEAVIVDFDRTLLHTDKTISEYTIRVLRDCRESGTRLFAATARPERAITTYCNIIEFDAVTTLNGARTITKDDVYENPVSMHSAEQILRQLSRTEDMIVSMETENGIYANTDIPVWKPTVTDNLAELSRKEKIYKILASHPRLSVEQIVPDLPEDTYSSVADRMLLQIMSKTATKWNGVRKMLEVYQIEPSRTVYFGDDNDDAESIRYCGCGVAVSNALDCIREIADYITGSNDEDGVARFLAEYT